MTPHCLLGSRCDLIICFHWIMPLTKSNSKLSPVSLYFFFFLDDCIWRWPYLGTQKEACTQVITVEGRRLIKMEETGIFHSISDIDTSMHIYSETYLAYDCWQEGKFWGLVLAGFRRDTCIQRWGWLQMLQEAVRSKPKLHRYGYLQLPFTPVSEIV